MKTVYDKIKDTSSRLVNPYYKILSGFYLWLNRLTVVLVMGYAAINLIDAYVSFQVDNSDYIACQADDIYGGTPFTKIMGKKIGEIKILRISKNLPSAVISYQREYLASSSDVSRLFSEEVYGFDRSTSLANRLLDSSLFEPYKLIVQSSISDNEIIVKWDWDPIFSGIVEWEGERRNEVVVDKSTLLFDEFEKSTINGENLKVSQGRCVIVPQDMFEVEWKRQQYELEAIELNALSEAMNAAFLNQPRQ